MSESRRADAESRNTIRKELLTNILVEAGAGSGKTQMLAERMAAGVAEGVYQIEHMAAVTFTRKAASELRGRFHLALEQRLRALPRTPNPESRAPESERLNAALGNLERFFAGTIHSFCARLLRERPVESGVSPGFTELDEVQDLELRKRAWRDFIASARSAGDPDMMALLETGVRPNDLDSAFSIVCGNEDVHFPPGDAECPDPEVARKSLETFWKALQLHLPTTIDPETTCKIQKAALQFRGQLRVARYRLDRPAVMASLLGTWACESKIVQRCWADSAAAKKRLKDVVCTLHADLRATTADPYLAQWRQYIYKLSVTLLARARDQAARERRRVNSLNYGDLLNLTARVLRENGQVRRALQRNYRFLFVDEFQDTDPVQAEIAFLLAADESRVVKAVATWAQESHVAPLRTPSPEPRVPAHDWRTLPLRPGALFVVGDPKQSIYRFRRADIEIYNLVRSRFSDPAVGRVLPLTRNYRSVPALCEWANQVFQTRFPATPSAHSPRFAALDPRDQAGEGTSRDGGTAPGGVFTLTHACAEAAEVITEDAKRISRYVRAEVDAGRRKYSDFLILTRKKRNRIGPYAAALEAVNVPIEVSGAGAFGESAEVAALTVLLRSLADPQDALSLVAVLRGPLFGISDPELFAFKQAGGWFSTFFQDAQNARGARPATAGASVRSALAALQQYYRWTRVLPAAAALDRILEHTGYLALAATTPGGVEAGDLVHAMDRVREVVEEGGSLADAADALDDDTDDASEVESLPLEPGRSDVVRVMNLHKAKGLEADVVFLADPCGGLKPRVDVHIARDGAQAQGWFQVEHRWEGFRGSTLLGEHADWAGHEATELPYLQAEEDRLLYVAATRARQMLVVSRWLVRPAGSSAWGALNGFLSSATELPVPQGAMPVVVTPPDCSTAAQAEGERSRAAAHDGVDQASWSITSVTAEARHIARMTRAADPAGDDPTRVVATDTPTHRADAGMAWGTLIHGLLEHAMRHPTATRGDLRRLAMWLTVEEAQLRDVIDRALDTVQTVAASDFWKEARASSRVHEEIPFAINDSDGHPSQVTSGVVDLAFRGDSSWMIVDYKTDTVDAADVLASKHADQLRAYERVWIVITGEDAESQVVSARH